MRKYTCLMMSIALLLICATAVGADIPRLITYQGRLTDDIGIPIPDGTYNIDFAIYDDSISGSLLWGEIHSVTTTDGLFSVQLGLHSSLDESIFIDHADLFLRMQISGSPEKDNVAASSNLPGTQSGVIFIPCRAIEFSLLSTKFRMYKSGFSFLYEV